MIRACQNNLCYCYILLKGSSLKKLFYLMISFNSNIGDQVSTAQHQRLELKIKELETKLELEQTTRGRMDTQISRLKEAIEKLNHECDSLRVKVSSLVTY